jgi:hypothetical protein
VGAEEGEATTAAAMLNNVRCWKFVVGQDVATWSVNVMEIEQET